MAAALLLLISRLPIRLARMWNHTALTSSGIEYSEAPESAKLAASIMPLLLFAPDIVLTAPNSVHHWTMTYQ